MELMSILCAMGIPALDEHLGRLVDAMRELPEGNVLGSLTGWAKMIGLCIALGVGSYECWMMILGRRGMDVMKILHIVIISMCISFSTTICSAISAPGRALEGVAADLATAENTKIVDKEKEVAAKLDEYSDKLNDMIANTIANERAEAEKNGEDEGVIDEAINAIMDSTVNPFISWAKQQVFLGEVWIFETLSYIIRFIGEAIFQITYYGLMVAQKIFMNILAAFCPLMFALSLAPPWKSAWSQWMSKYISLSLWGFVAYMCIFFIDQILFYFLSSDLSYYSTLISKGTGDWSEIGSVGMEGLGTACMYAVGMLIGAFTLKFVPEVSSWLIPGGVSSSGGQALAAAAGGGAYGMTKWATKETKSNAKSYAKKAGNQGARNLSKNSLIG